MGLNNITKISFINTPPIAKQPPITRISLFNTELIKEAIESELERKGQIFIVVPFIKNIDGIKNDLIDMGFEKMLATAHGKFKPDQLANIMEDFNQNKIQILLSTSIIEYAKNIANVNTIIVPKNLKARKEEWGRVRKSRGPRSASNMLKCFA